MFVIDRLYAAFLSVGRRTWIVSLLCVFGLCVIGFSVRSQFLGTKPLAARLWYEPSAVQQFLADLGPAGRNLYAITQVSLDMVFPAVYGTLIAAALVRLYPKHLARWLLLMPLLMVFADYAENGATAYL